MEFTIFSKFFKYLLVPFGGQHFGEITPRKQMLIKISDVSRPQLTHSSGKDTQNNAFGCKTKIPSGYRLITKWGRFCLYNCNKKWVEYFRLMGNQKNWLMNQKLTQNTLLTPNENCSVKPPFQPIATEHENILSLFNLIGWHEDGPCLCLRLTHPRQALLVLAHNRWGVKFLMHLKYPSSPPPQSEILRWQRWPNR